jgi:hypothetical protein
MSLMLTHVYELNSMQARPWDAGLQSLRPICMPAFIHYGPECMVTASHALNACLHDVGYIQPLLS